MSFRFRFRFLPSLTRRALLAVAVAAALPASVSHAQGTPVRGGTLVAIVQPEPIQLTSTTNNNFPNGVVGANIFEGLVRYDEKLRPQPSLATSWTVSKDGLAITFHLRQGVRWHDGVEFTSADVKYSALELWKKVHSRGRITFAPLEDVLTPDKYTAVFKLSHPSLVIFSALNAVEGQVMPRHLYEGTDPFTNPYNLKPVGTGPFRFKSWTKGQSIELERNPDYWDKPKPYVDRLIFRVIPDASTRAVALETGEVLYAPYDAVPVSDLDRLRKLPDLNVSTTGYEWQSQYVFLEFNLHRPPLDNLKVRQAIYQAINRQGLIDTVWYGLGKVSTGPIPSTLSTFYTAQVPQYPYDPAKAEKLLDEAGFPRKAGGVRFTLTQDYQPFNDTFRNNAEYIRQNLKKVGIEMTVRNQDLATFVKRVYTDYDYDTDTGQWSPLMDPQMGVNRAYSSKGFNKGTPWTNASGYANPAMDKVIAATEVEPDPAKRVKDFHELQVIAQTDLPVLPLFEMRHFTISNKRLQGLSKAPDAALSSLKDAWIVPQK